MRAALERACAPFRLAPTHQGPMGRAGERLGRGTGVSLEFMDFREYLPGDDLRHVDWRAYARTDQLKVRLYREEVAPALEIIVDLSPSMAVTPAKGAAARDLVEAFAYWGAEEGGHVRRMRCGGDLFDDADAVVFDAIAGPKASIAAPRVALRPRSVRVLISDFLFPENPVAILRDCIRGAAALNVVQLLDPWETSPTDAGLLSLRDCETGERADVTLDAAARAGYVERLLRLRDSVAHATRALAGRYACVTAAEPRAMFAGALMRAGIVEPG